MTTHSELPPDRDSAETSAFERQTRQAFERSVDALDADVGARLNRARRQALDTAARNPLLPPWLSWQPAAVAASVIVAAFAGYALWQADPDETANSALVADATDLEMLLGEDELEMFEDLEFYAWLAEQPEFAEDVADDDGSG